MSGCAIGADGQLLDASEIEFFNDVDDDMPISGLSNLPDEAVAHLNTLLDGFVELDSADD